MLYQIQKDNKHHYTYSDKYLAGAFPLVDLKDNEELEKMISESKFKSPKGFDTLNKRKNWNALPKKPTDAEIQALIEPYHISKKEQKQKLKSFAYIPSEHGGRDFKSKCMPEEHFSD